MSAVNGRHGEGAYFIIIQDKTESSSNSFERAEGIRRLSHSKEE